MNPNSESAHIGYQHGYDGEDFAFENDADYAAGYDAGVNDAATNYHIVYNH